MIGGGERLRRHRARPAGRIAPGYGFPATAGNDTGSRQPLPIILEASGFLALITKPLRRVHPDFT